MNPMLEIRAALEVAALLLSLALIVVAFRTARRMGRLDEASLSTTLFLHANLVRRFLVAFALAALLFVAMPVSILAYLFTDRDAFEVVHDASHVVFLLLVLGGAYQLSRLPNKP